MLLIQWYQKTGSQSVGFDVLCFFIQGIFDLKLVFPIFFNLWKVEGETKRLIQNIPVAESL